LFSRTASCLPHARVIIVNVYKGCDRIKNHTKSAFLPLSHRMKGGRIHTIHADDLGDDEPMEENWFKRKEKKGSQSQEANRAPSRVFPGQIQEASTPAVYEGDPTEQEVIDNIRNLPDIRLGGKVIVSCLTNRF